MSKKGFKKIWKTQTELGQQFGISAIAVGKILKKHHLKNEENIPTNKAIEEQYVHTVEDSQGNTFYLWNIKTKQIIQQEIQPISLVQQTVHFLETKYKAIQRDLKNPDNELIYDKFGPDIIESIWDEAVKNLNNAQLLELKNKIQHTTLKMFIQ